MKYLFILLLLMGNCAFAQYNFYYGNIHSHTEYSDGNKDSAITGVSTPGASFAYAKASYHIDFWGISEHNHYNANNNPGMLLPRYAAGLYQADTANANGTFVAMYGMEFGTISTGGHVLSFGIPQLVGWETVFGNPNYDVYCNEGDYVSYWNIAHSFPNSFCTLAHPETGDYNDLLLTAAFNPLADSVIVGTAVRSGSAFSTTTDYTDPPAGSYEFQYRRALAKGYHVGPAIDHDNHYTTFGRTVQGRTVVLAPQLHRDSIMAAYKARRFYASDDWNTEVMFSVNNAIMGSNIETAADAAIQVSVNDLDVTDTIINIQIFHGIAGSGVLPSVLTSIQNSNTFAYTHSIALNVPHYYYAKITQKDGDIIWTAPVWVKKTSFPLPVTHMVLTAKIQNSGVLLQMQTDEGLYTELEHSANGIDFSPLWTYVSSRQPQEFLHEYADAGNNYYRLKVTDVNGEFYYSDIASVYIHKPNALYSVFPNPVRDKLNIQYTSSNYAKAELKIYNTAGIEVQRQAVEILPSQNNFQADVSCLPGGLYLLVIQKENERLIDTKFIKL